MELQKLPDQLVDSVYSPELIDIAVELSDVGIDQFLDDGFVKDLPVVGVIAKIFKAGLDIRDRIFIAKIAKFLFKLKEVPEKQSIIFKEKISEDQNFKKKVGQTLVLLLERLDDLEKPNIIGKCFAYYLSNKISFADFRRLSAAIELAFIDDLYALLGEHIEKSSFVIDSKENLVRTGLIRIQGSGAIGGGDEIHYFLSQLGQLFVNIMTDKVDQLMTV